MKSLGVRTTKAARVTLTPKKKSKAQTGSRSCSKEMAARKAGSVPPAEPASVRFQDTKKTKSDDPYFCHLAACEGVDLGGCLRLPKEPSSAKYAAMAGAMYNALERLRVFYQTLNGLRVQRISFFENRVDSFTDGVALNPVERRALLDELAAAQNILRAGLKARNAK